MAGTTCAQNKVVKSVSLNRDGFLFYISCKIDHWFNMAVNLQHNYCPLYGVSRKVCGFFAPQFALGKLTPHISNMHTYIVVCVHACMHAIPTIATIWNIYVVLHTTLSSRHLQCFKSLKFYNTDFYKSLNMLYYFYIFTTQEEKISKVQNVGSEARIDLWGLSVYI